MGVDLGEAVRGTTSEPSAGTYPIRIRNVSKCPSDMYQSTRSRSGKADPVQFKGRFQNGCFAGSFLLLGTVGTKNKLLESV